MKKMIISTIIVLALIFTLPISNINSVNAVEVGDRILYVVNSANMSYSYSVDGITLSGSKTNFDIADSILDPGNEFNITVKSIDPTLIEFEATVNGTSLGNTLSVSGNFDSGIFESMIFPFLAMGLSNVTIYPGSVSSVGIGDWIFFAPTDIDLDEMHEIFNNKSYWDNVSAPYPEEITFSVDSKFLDNGDTIYFEFEASGNYKNTTEAINLTVDHSVRYYYSVVDRNLLSFNINTDIDGTLEGTSASYKTNLEVVKKGFSPSNEGIPGFEILLSLFSVGILTILIKRRK